MKDFVLSVLETISTVRLLAVKPSQVSTHILMPLLCLYYKCNSWKIFVREYYSCSHCEKRYRTCTKAEVAETQNRLRDVLKKKDYKGWILLHISISRFAQIFGIWLPVNYLRPQRTKHLCLCWAISIAVMLIPVMQEQNYWSADARLSKWCLITSGTQTSIIHARSISNWGLR